MYKFNLGNQSRKNLEGVHPKLVAVVERAIQLTDQDFTVHEGLRSVEDQLKAFNEGHSKLKFGKHQPQNDGYGHAVDLVPWIDGKTVWDWNGCYRIAAAMNLAARQFGTPVRWGGVWDKPLVDIIPTSTAMKDAVEAYKARHAGADFLDGPHYEIYG